MNGQSRRFLIPKAPTVCPPHLAVAPHGSPRFFLLRFLVVSIYHTTSISRAKVFCTTYSTFQREVCLAGGEVPGSFTARLGGSLIFPSCASHRIKLSAHLRDPFLGWACKE